MLRRQPTSLTFPYTTLFRSYRAVSNRAIEKQQSIGGEGGIRTHGTVTRTTVFETVPFDHSGTSPRANTCANGSQERHLYSARDRKSTRLNSSHLGISYAVFC